MSYNSKYTGTEVETGINKAYSALQGKVVNITPTGATPQQFMATTPSGDPMHYAYIATGAVYNETDSDIIKDAPWKTLADDGGQVYHKSKCWYLNGVGDLTTDEMRKIFIRGYFNDNETYPLGYGGANAIRVNLGRAAGQNGRYNNPVSSYNGKIEVINLSIYDCHTENYSNHVFAANHGYFVNNTKLKHITGGYLTVEISNTSMFQNCKELITARIRPKTNLFLNHSPNFSKGSLLYAINNEYAPSNITITLHATAYARLANDADILAALSEHPKVSLISA